MPMKSQAMRKAMWAAKNGDSDIGIPQEVGEKFADHDQGGPLPAKAQSQIRKPKAAAQGNYIRTAIANMVKGKAGRY